MVAAVEEVNVVAAGWLAGMEREEQEDGEHAVSINIAGTGNEISFWSRSSR